MENNEISNYFSVQRNRVIDLQEHCLGKVKFGGPLENYRSEDIRKYSIERIEYFSYSSIPILHLLENLKLRSPADQKILYNILGVLDVQNYGVGTKDSLLRTSRLSLCNLSYFILDHCLEILIYTLGLKSFNSLDRNLGELVRGLNLNRDSFSSIDVLRKVRNSFHNDGIHIRETEKTVVINSIQYEFIKGKPILITHESIANLLISCVDEVVNLFLHPTIKSFDFISKDNTSITP